MTQNLMEFSKVMSVVEEGRITIPGSPEYVYLTALQRQLPLGIFGQACWAEYVQYFSF